MQDIHSQIMMLKRPQLLVRAARFGMDDYVRERHLKRILGADTLPGPGAVIMHLLEVEREANDARVAKSGDYSVARHVDVLVAIMSEAQVLRATSTPRLVANKAG